MCKKEIEKKIIDTLIFILMLFTIMLSIFYFYIINHSYEKNALLTFLLIALVFNVILISLRIYEHGKPSWLKYCIKNHCTDTRGSNKPLIEDK